MLHTKFQASKPSGSEEENLKILLYVFLWFKPRTPGQRPSWTWDFHLIKLSRGTLGNATYQISTSGPSASEEDFLKYISMPFYGSNLGPPGEGPSWSLGPSFEQN